MERPRWIYLASTMTSAKHTNLQLHIENRIVRMYWCCLPISDVCADFSQTARVMGFTVFGGPI